MGRHSARDDEDADLAVAATTAPATPPAGAPDDEPVPAAPERPASPGPSATDTGRHHLADFARALSASDQPPPAPAGHGGVAVLAPPAEPAHPGTRPATPGAAPVPPAAPAASVGGSAGATAVDDGAVPGPEAGPAARRSRAGRDLPAAIGVGVGLGAVVLLSLFLYRPAFLAVVIVAVALGCYELRGAIATVEARPPLVPLVVGGAAVAVAAWERGTNGVVVAALLTAAAVVVWRLGDGVEGYLRDVASALLVLAYLPVLAGFAVLLARPDDGPARIVVFVATVVCSDTGGYATGVWLGRHPLAPGVSKGKTWEGSAGSLVACCLAGALFLSLVFHQPWWQGVVFGAAIMVTATLGDLGESMIKRDLGVKDMGRLLPGHGGLMDRLDSILPCAVVAYLLLQAFAPAVGV